MNIYYVVFDEAGGILRSGFCPERSLSLQQGPCFGLIQTEDLIDSGGYYIDLSGAPAVVEKQPYTLDTLPVPCTLLIDGEAYTVSEQSDLSFEWPGTYEIRVIPELPQYLEMEFTQVVTESEATGVLNA